MKVVVKEKYKGELEEKKEDLIKALFPNVRSIEEALVLPERKLREKAAQDMLNIMDKRYRQMLDGMFDAIEEVLIREKGK